MKKTLFLIALLATATLGGACSFENRTEVLLPTAPGSDGTPATPTAASVPLIGTWTSPPIAAPDPGSCGNFEWQVTNATSDSLMGDFSATCAGGVTIRGTAAGRLEGTSVPLAVGGSANYGGAVSCEFSLSGTGTLENNETLTIPYSGTTCLGPISGTQVLRRPQPDGSAPPPPEPVDPLFGCGGLAEKALVKCIWDHIQPTDNNSAFEVTKRVAWALRGEGAGLLIKNGGDNVTAWQGSRFSSSRICYPDGRLVKVIYDAGPGGANGASWQDNDDYVSRSLYVPAIDPSLP
jgi:hypothetical protein